MRDDVALVALVVAAGGVAAIASRRRDVAAVIALTAGVAVSPAVLDLVVLTPRVGTVVLVPAALLLVLAGAAFGRDLRRDLLTSVAVAGAAVAAGSVTVSPTPVGTVVAADLLVAPVVGAAAGLVLVARDRRQGTDAPTLLLVLLLPAGLVAALGGSGLLAPLATGVVASRRRRGLAVEAAVLPLVDLALYAVTVAVGVGLGAAGSLPAAAALAVAGCLLVVRARPAPQDPLLPLPATTLGVLAAAAVPATAAVPRSPLAGVAAVAAVALLTVQRSPAVPDRIAPRSTSVAA